MKKLKRVVLLVPESFLDLFDRKTKGIYASRNEAIRAGMKLIMDADIKE